MMIVDAALYKLKLDTNGVHDDLNRATHCPDAVSRYCVGKLLLYGFIEYTPFCGDVNAAAFGHASISSPLWQVDALPSSAVRR